MSLNDLYQEIILDHGKKPRNFGELETATHEAEGFNPLCGDQVRVRVRIEEGKIADLRFSGHGCAISTASASMMTQLVKGKTVDQAVALVEKFREAMTSDSVGPEGMGELGCLSGVKQFPNRVKCATLAWHTLRSAVTGGGKVTTEKPDA
ncbi:MAG TPA: SUF system NifU family Fe-S cluster assembly protein [Fimbriimonadaceae bacterium]|nr:SUF system NifU family Fe-S cluster assembly protein [Fimbriimonadaceae bacterium]